MEKPCYRSRSQSHGTEPVARPGGKKKNVAAEERTLVALAQLLFLLYLALPKEKGT